MRLHTRLICFVLLAATLTCKAQQDYKSFPLWNYKLPVEARVNDVVSRLTLEEKVAQMLNAAPAVGRLGIPAYDWWNEVLHGVARTPFKVTVFPQAIAMAATWDTNSLFKMADYAALEGRAIHNKAIELGRANERYLGLTYWTPNINIFRDPRWGRGQETYGEDPFLTSMLARAFVHGLQGDDPVYLKAAACAKHFAVHSGPEPTRHSDNFNPSTYDLWDTYLPAFKELVVNAKVAGVMCAYNAINTQPCCANDLLMNDILRNQWKFTGYVTSDCWAVDDFFRYHKTHPDATASAVDAVMHGTDVECGQTVYKTLVDAVKSGLIKESQLDISLKRLFTIRFRLGMFDPPSIVKYARTPSSELESPQHKAHALKMAQQAIVLLRNEPMPGKNIPVLPLSKNIKTIAVIGPNADNKIAVLGNYNGVPSEIVTALEGIKNKLGKDVKVLFEKGINFTNDTLLTYADVSNLYSWNGRPGFNAEYFNNTDLKGTPVATLTESKIDHSWQEGETITGNLRATNFSARYTTLYISPNENDITFEVDGDDGYKFFINDKEILNGWQRNRWGAKTYKLAARKDSVYKLMLEYWQGDGKGNVSLRAGNFEKNDIDALVKRISNAGAIIYVGGISPQLEGEEMKVDYPGFNGGDRTSIMLPAVQTDILKKLQTTAKPLVFVMMTGSALAIPWEAENVPAIVNAWYGGQSAGAAIADVLFGDYNPAGRLPVTFYKSDRDLAAFSSYDMTNRTYRYFTGQALYPFGYGLSYTKFTYSKIAIASSIKAGQKLQVRVVVSNTGKKAGEEVVQVYVSNQNKMIRAPLRALKAFQRIFLKAGESKQLEFELSAQDLSTISETGAAIPLTGNVIISVGGGQPGILNKTTSNVLTKTISIR